MTREEVTAKIDEIILRPTMSDWALGFCESISDQLSRGRTLSPRQLEVFQTILEQNTLEEVEKLKNWSMEYREKYEKHAVVLAKYYTCTGYYLQLASDILAGNVPTPSVFMKMYNNKYAKKVIAEYSKAPRFEIGSHVMGNAQCSHAKMRDCNKRTLMEYKLYSLFKRSGGLIIEIDNNTVLSSAKGSKRYKILPIASVETFWIEERFMKKAKTKKNQL